MSEQRTDITDILVLGTGIAGCAGGQGPPCSLSVV